MKKFIALMILLNVYGISYSQNNNCIYHKYLGKEINDPEISLLWKSYKITDTTDMPTGYFYNARKQGISFRFDKSLKLTHIFLYKDGIDGFEQYNGKMPHGLSFDISRQQAEAKLGKPERVGGGTYSNIYAIYNGGMSITYTTLNSSDKNAKIEVINIIKE